MRVYIYIRIHSTDNKSRDLLWTRITKITNIKSTDFSYQYKQIITFWSSSALYAGLFIDIFYIQFINTWYPIDTECLDKSVKCY